MVGTPPRAGNPATGYLGLRLASVYHQFDVYIRKRIQYGKEKERKLSDYRFGILSVHDSACYNTEAFNLKSYAR